MDSNTFEADLAVLKAAQPRWMADGIGIATNAVEVHREQARVNWPSAGITRRSGEVITTEATPGAPEAPTSVPAG